jgi:pSer/pThr/pTyr-binding forkhead associated (FHA) protein
MIAGVGPTQQMTAGGIGDDVYRTQIGAVTTCPVCKATTPAPEIYCGDCGFLLTTAPGEPIEVPVEETAAAELVDATDGRRYRLRQGINTLGRQATDILVNEGTVSRVHARIIIEGENVIVEDLGSSNGTKVGDRRIGPNQPTPATHGMPLKFGNWRAVLEIAGAGPLPTPGAAEPTITVAAGDRTQMDVALAPKAAPAPPPPPTGPQVAVLTKTEGPAKDIPIHEGTITVGRRSSNTISLPQDAYISGRHAEIITDNTGTYLIDLGSTNGTVVNGQKMVPNERQLLLDGDEVKLGQNTYRFSLLDEPIGEEATEGAAAAAEAESEGAPAEPADTSAEAAEGA